MCSKWLAICSNWSATFSRMRSEGFPFIVVVGSVTSLLYGRRDAQCDKIISFKVWKVEEASHEMLVLALQTLKMGSDFRVLSGRRNTLEACHRRRVVVFCGRRSTLQYGVLHLCGRRCILWHGESGFSMNRSAKAAQTRHRVSKVVADATYCDILWLPWKVAQASQKIILLQLSRNWRFSRWTCEICKEVSHEMLLFVLPTLKVEGHFCVLRGRRNTIEACLHLRVGVRRRRSTLWRGEGVFSLNRNFTAAQIWHRWHSVTHSFVRKTRRKSSIFTFKVLDGRHSDVVSGVRVVLCSTE